MGFFDNFPYTNFHELNLDWLLQAMKNLDASVREYMAVNKVGFGGIWDITKQYPAYTVVADGSKSYISLQPVPSGVAIENTEYWQLLADLDPRIGPLVEEVERLAADLSAVEKKTGDNTTAIAKTDSRLDGLEDEQLRDMLILGNSWVTGGQRAEGMAGGWGNYIGGYYKGGNIFSGAVSGQGIASGEYLQQFNKLIADGHDKNIKYVIISGCINDRNNPNSVQSALYTLIDRIRDVLPRAEIIFVSPDCSTDVTKLNGNRQVCNNIDAACQTRGVAAYFWQDMVLVRRADFVGDYHINEAFANRIASWVAAVLEGGNLAWRVNGNGGSLADWDGTGTWVFISDLSIEVPGNQNPIYTVPETTMVTDIRATNVVTVYIQLQGKGYVTGYMVGNRVYCPNSSGTCTSIRFKLPPYTYTFS